jgi:hypothetical protein
MVRCGFCGSILRVKPQLHRILRFFFFLKTHPPVFAVVRFLWFDFFAGFAVCDAVYAHP